MCAGALPRGQRTRVSRRTHSPYSIRMYLATCACKRLEPYPCIYAGQVAFTVGFRTDDEVDDVYAEVARTIERRIKDGTYPFRSRLPAREELAAELGVAAMTVRRAVAVLADPGRDGGALVRVLPGSGTYVIWRA